MGWVARHTASLSAAFLELAPAAARAPVIATDRLFSAHRSCSTLHERLEVRGVLRLVGLNADDNLPAISFSDRHYLVRALHRLHPKHRWSLRRSQLCHLISPCSRPPQFSSTLRMSDVFSVFAPSFCNAFSLLSHAQRTKLQELYRLQSARRACPVR